MRIHELIIEQQIDEGVGSAIEKGIGGISKAAGYLAGIPGGIKQQFQTGKARATAGIGGTLKRPAAPDPTFTQALQNYQTHGTATAPAGSPAAASAADPASMRKQAQDFKKQSDELMKQADAAEKAANQAAAQSNQQTQTAQTAPPAGSPAAASANTAQQAPSTSANSNQRIEPTLNSTTAGKTMPGDKGFGFNTATGAAYTSAAERDSSEADNEVTGANALDQKKSPEQIRQAKQAPAAAAAQQQMAANPAPTAKPGANFAQQSGAYGKQTMNVPAGIPKIGGLQATQAPAVKPGAPGAAALLKPKPSFAPKAESVEFHSKFLGRML